MTFVIAILKLMTPRLCFGARVARLMPASAKLTLSSRNNMTVGKNDANAGGPVSIAALSLLACGASSINRIEKRVTVTQWLVAHVMALAPESTNGVIPSNDHPTLRRRLTASVGDPARRIVASRAGCPVFLLVAFTL
jgi:hypothetical protein